MVRTPLSPGAFLRLPTDSESAVRLSVSLCGICRYDTYMCVGPVSVHT